MILRQQRKTQFLQSFKQSKHEDVVSQSENKATYNIKDSSSKAY